MKYRDMRAVIRRERESAHTADPSALVGDQWKLTSAAASSRQHWHQRATELAILDCHLLELLPWDESALAKLPASIYRTLTMKLQELVEWACKQGDRNVEYALAKAIWRYVKTLKPGLQPFGEY